MFTPIFETILNGKAITGAYVDLSDLSNPVWEIFEIDVVPTVVVFKDGNPVFRRDGIPGRGLSRKDMEEIVGQATSGPITAET